MRAPERAAPPLRMFPESPPPRDQDAIGGQIPHAAIQNRSIDYYCPAAACVTVNTARPPTVIVPVRDMPVLFWSAR